MISSKIDVLLEQMANGNISEALFKKLIGEYERKQIELIERLSEQKAELSAIKDDIGNIKHLMDCFKKRVYIETLNRDTIVELIDYRCSRRKKSAKSICKELMFISTSSETCRD